MKLVAGRDIDKYDIPALRTASGVQSREELYRLVDENYTDDQPPRGDRDARDVQHRGAGSSA